MLGYAKPPLAASDRTGQRFRPASKADMSPKETFPIPNHFFWGMLALEPEAGQCEPWQHSGFQFTYDWLLCISRSSSQFAGVGSAGCESRSFNGLNQQTWFSTSNIVYPGRRCQAKEFGDKLQTSFPIDEEIDPAGEMIVLKTHFTPFMLSSMSKDKNPFGFLSNSNLKGLTSWTEPVQELASFGAGHFTPFLPPPAAYGVLGAAYEILPSQLSTFSGSLSSYRYFPPKVSGKEVILHRLLGLFHPRPFVYMRFGPQGAVATVRAENERWVDVVFRIHAEFQLNEPPLYPFWFTPAQFTGNIILTRDASRVRHFHLYVPANRSLNVDMEWMHGTMQENMEVDIGYIPQLALTSVAPSMPVLIYQEDGSFIDQREAELSEESFERTIFMEEDHKDIKWNTEISMEEAMKSLEVKMCLTTTSLKPSAELRQKTNWSIPFCCGGHWMTRSGRTLREGPLESSPILKMLSDHFVSTWVLVAELEDIKTNSSIPKHKELATLALDAYVFPVEMMVSLPNGTVLHHLNANHLLDMSSSESYDVASNMLQWMDPASVTYSKFLKEGMKKAGVQEE
ncbi:skeletal muscle fiber development [Branchiostoma belcheri]|nr:skeletal muscle fiber development [Branchiostoma belcheri]